MLCFLVERKNQIKDFRMNMFCYLYKLNNNGLKIQP